MIDWLDERWSEAHTVQVVERGEDGGGLSGRRVITEIRAPGEMRTAKALMTAGQLTGHMCGCHGEQTIVLRGRDGGLLGSASLHGYGTVSWERHRFRNDLHVADPTGLHLFLAEHGVSGQLACFMAPLVEALDLREGRPQFRPAGVAGQAALEARGVPEELHPLLAGFSGRQAAAVPAATIDCLWHRLVHLAPEPVDRAGVLLSWLGHLPVTGEALFGEGVLVRRLLAELSTLDIRAAAATPTGHIVMGVVNWSLWNHEDTGALAAAIGPTLRAVLP
jgi:hypothetical protein